jgi:hypothetical protein
MALTTGAVGNFRDKRAYSGLAVLKRPTCGEIHGADLHGPPLSLCRGAAAAAPRVRFRWLRTWQHLSSPPLCAIGTDIGLPRIFVLHRVAIGS